MSLIQSKSILKSISSPVFWFGLFLVFFSFYNYSGREETQAIRSDMRGYYSYLPAILSHNDPSFQKCLEAEAQYLQGKKNQNYLVKTENGGVHNKYFPGVALLQSPFYAMATAISWMTGIPTDGYSATYQLFLQIGATFYAILGLLLFYSLLKNLFPEQKTLIRWLLPVLYLATPLFHYSVNTLSFSHSYSFFLFGLFSWFIIKMRKEVYKWYFLGLGLTLGMIVLVRPTNLIIILIIPFLLGNTAGLRVFWRQLFKNRAQKFIYGTAGVLLIIFNLFLIWKWESGSWLIWSYGGEGFTFLSPHIIASLFSFRVGLFLHTPILILSIVGLVYLYKSNKFQAFWWALYFIVNCWVISSWWAWDYESAFGNRPYTEHLIFILLPLFTLLQQRKVWSYSFIGLFFIVGLIRISTFNSGFMVNQKFTRKNYFMSLAFWKDANFDRWAYPKSCRPFGVRTRGLVLREQKGELQINPNDIFNLSGKATLPLPRTTERLYFRVVLDKMTTEAPLEDVLLVLDARNEKTGASYYRALPLHNDRLEGVNEWAHVEFESLIPDNLQTFSRINIYIWNKGGKQFKIKNFKIVLEEYKS